MVREAGVMQEKDQHLKHSFKQRKVPHRRTEASRCGDAQGPGGHSTVKASASAEPHDPFQQ
jgi:hypothetical protein